MSDSNTCASPGQSGRVDRSTSTGSPEAPEKRQDRKVGYPFDAMPKLIEQRIRAGTLKPIDGRVLMELLRWRRAFVASCWVSVEKVAAELGVSPRTVQRSFARLSQGDPALIRQAAVPSPDPDEPQNRTGWRIHFPFIPGPPLPIGKGPDRSPNEARRKWVKVAGQAEQQALPLDVSASSVSPPPGDIRGHEIGRAVSPNYAGDSAPVLDSQEPEKTQTPSSSSSEPEAPAPPEPARKDDDDDFSPSVGREEREPESAEAVRVAEQLFPGKGVSGRIEHDAEAIGKRMVELAPGVAVEALWACYVMALFMAWGRGSKRVPTPDRWSTTLATDFAKRGVQAEAEDAREKWERGQRLAAQASRGAPLPGIATDDGIREPTLDQLRGWLDDDNPTLVKIARDALAEIEASSGKGG